MNGRVRLFLVSLVLAAVLAAALYRVRRGPRAAGGDMAEIPASVFRMGTGEVRAEVPKQPPGQKPLWPADVLAARLDPAWRLADERPAHEVSLKEFSIDRAEVTNAQYREFVEWVRGGGGHKFCHPGEPAGKDHAPRYWGDFNPLLNDPDYARLAPFSRKTFTEDDAPVVGVDWFDAYAFARWRGKRLPTEAEWERACAGEPARRWPWGDEWRWGYANAGGETVAFDQDLARKKDGAVYAVRAGRFPEGRSAAGCDDMAGNAAEWVADWYAEDYYANSPRADPPGPERGERRVVRGGSYRNYPSALRCAARAKQEPEFRSAAIGFRCAKDR